MDLKIRKNKKSYTIRDIYTAYHKINENAIYSHFKRILDAVNKVIKDEVLQRSGCFKMPSGLGMICIVKYKPKAYTSKSLSKDYKSSKEEGKTIYYLNEHSNGYKYRLYWSKQPYTFSDRYKYQIILTRTNKRYLAQLIFNHNDYIDINDIQIYKV